MNSETPDNTLAAHSATDKAQKSAPSILDNVRNRAVETLSALVGTLFEQIDDTFFELADAAHNNNEQNIYFEAMREIRMQRTRVENTFFTLFEADFSALSTPTTTHSAKQVTESLALLDHEDVEIDVALGTMSNQARCEFPALLLQINTRLSEFFAPLEITEDNNPLDPQQVVTHFVKATEHFDVGLQSRLIFLKQFDRLVLRHYEQILLDTNQILIAAGILPDLRSVVRRAPTRPTSPARSAQTEKTPPEKAQVAPEQPAQKQNAPTSSANAHSQPNYQGGGNAFNTLQGLLAATHNLQQPSVYIDSNLPPASHQEIFGFLDTIQKNTTLSTDPNQDPPPVQSVNVHHSISALLNKQEQEQDQRKIDQLDTDIINIVDMIFDYILTQNLPAPMALLIGRLQIPVLKTAMKDKAFFNTNQHPARRLLNLIGHVCLGWDHNTNPQNDRLYQQVENSVRDILETYTDDISIFEEAEQHLLTFIKKEEVRSRTMEQRTIAIEEGKAKTDQGRQLIRQLVRDRIQGKELPPIVIEFLKNPWQKLLLQALLKEGKSSYTWRTTLQVADDLIWSVRPQKNETARKRWLKMIPVLLGDIKAGLLKIAYKPSDTDKMMSHLWKIHSQMLTYKGTENPLRTVKVDLTDQQPLNVTNPKIIAKKESIQTDIFKELLHQVALFKSGTWFTFQDADDKLTKCKLTTKIRATDSYVFVNRFGAKAKQFTREELAIALHDKKVSAMNAGPIIDRALEAIMSKLKASLP
ncbi:hypothetical protein A9Q99_11935 [Gammaproteobacteria bacterium 45_16_T64]|nr:hypothetical protein A9Q99_11935 [Gammaproteobacteria bacterium 45_16_T64]